MYCPICGYNTGFSTDVYRSVGVNYADRLYTGMAEFQIKNWEKYHKHRFLPKDDVKWLSGCPFCVNDGEITKCQSLKVCGGWNTPATEKQIKVLKKKYSNVFSFNRKINKELASILISGGKQTMKAFNGYDQAKESAKYTGGAKLPPGAYKAKILDVKYEQGQNGNSNRIIIQFDITDGDYKDFFRKQYDGNTSEDKKWKGRKSIYVPKDDGSDKDEWTKNSFAKWINGFEDSNNGYKWDWKEEKWKGLYVGIVFGETGTRIEGKDILYTEPRFACDVKKVRDGSYPKAKFVSKNGYGDNNSASSSSDGFMSIPQGAEEEIPFN
jgi:hypothetical protein